MPTSQGFAMMEKSEEAIQGGYGSSFLVVLTVAWHYRNLIFFADIKPPAALGYSPLHYANAANGFR